MIVLFCIDRETFIILASPAKPSVWPTIVLINSIFNTSRSVDGFASFSKEKSLKKI